MQNINKSVFNKIFPKVNLSQVTVEQIGGLTNQNFLIKEEDILYKKLKHNFDDFIDRDLEWKLIKQIKDFPKVYHFDKDLMIRDFLSDHSIIQINQLTQDKLQTIFDKVFYLNNLQPQFFDNTNNFKLKELLINEKFLNSILNFFNDHKQFISLKECKNFENILNFFFKERKNLFNFLERYPQDSVTLCHNDINIPNILIDKQDNIILLDYEYSNLNPYHYDIANFFVEASIDYHDRYPYFTIMDQSNLNNVKENIFDIYKQEKNIKSKNEFLEFCQIFQIYSHFFWLNVTIKSIQMDIQLDLNEYAIQRFKLLESLYKKYLQ